MELDCLSEERVSEGVPEATGLFDNFVTVDFVDISFDYSVGSLFTESQNHRVQIIGVAEVDQQALVAVPDTAWHRTRARRELPGDALLKAVRVEVRSASGLDRIVPEERLHKIWLGFLKAEYVDAVVCGADFAAGDFTFPVDALGVARLPYQCRQRCPCASRVCRRDGCAYGAIGDGALRPSDHGERACDKCAGSSQRFCAFPPGKPAMRATAKARADDQRVSPPPGLDPQVAQQALNAGVSLEALREIGSARGRERAAGVRTDELALSLSRTSTTKNWEAQLACKNSAVELW